MTTEEKQKQDWIDNWIEDDALLADAEAAWRKHCEDGPKDKGDAWDGGFACNH